MADTPAAPSAPTPQPAAAPATAVTAGPATPAAAPVPTATPAAKAAPAPRIPLEPGQKIALGRVVYAAALATFGALAGGSAFNDRVTLSERGLTDASKDEVKATMANRKNADGSKETPEQTRARMVRQFEEERAGRKAEATSLSAAPAPPKTTAAGAAQESPLQARLRSGTVAQDGKSPGMAGQVEIPGGNHSWGALFALTAGALLSFGFRTASVQGGNRLLGKDNKFFGENRGFFGRFVYGLRPNEVIANNKLDAVAGSQIAAARILHQNDPAAVAETARQATFNALAQKSEPRFFPTIPFTDPMKKAAIPGPVEVKQRDILDPAGGTVSFLVADQPLMSALTPKEKLTYAARHPDVFNPQTVKPIDLPAVPVALPAAPAVAPTAGPATPPPRRTPTP